MKIDKRLSEEFGTPLPEPTVHWSWRAKDMIEWFVGHLVPITVNAMLLAVGALIGRLYPPAIYWFLGISCFTVLCILAMFAVVLVANMFDIDPDDGYPGS